MSHGGGGKGGTCEPNMTPLLDLVLQILMFFIVTANFAQAENAGHVPLPESQVAHPLPKQGVKDPIFLNLLFNPDSRKHEVLFPLQVDAQNKALPPMQQQAEVRRFMKKLFEDLSRYDPEGKVKNPVIIRAHRDAEYNEVFQVLQSCSDAGFRNLQVRALIR